MTLRGSLLSAGLLLGAAMAAPGTAVASVGASADAGQVRSDRCEVVKDDRVSRFAVPQSCQSFYDKAHPCALPDDKRPAACPTQDMFKIVDWAGDDMIINTHRGVWGLKLDQSAVTRNNPAIIPCDTAPRICGAAENSLGGLLAAQSAGFATVEYDVALGLVDGVPTPVMTHLFDLAGFTGYAGEVRIPATGTAGQGFINTPTLSGKLPILRDRNRQVMSSDLKNQLVTLAQFLKIFSATPGSVMVLDLKATKPLRQFIAKQGKADSEGIGFTDANAEHFKAEFLQLLVKVRDIVLEQQLNQNIIIKIPIEVATPAEIEGKLGASMKKLLFAPQPDASGRMSQESVLAWIDAWNSPAYAATVSFWDTAILSSLSWQGRGIEVAGQRYADLMDYLRVKTNRRSAIWVNDPAGPGGRNGNYAGSWTFYGNDASDERGDAIANLRLSGSRHAVITSDRPDLFIQIRQYLKSGHAPATDSERTVR